MPESIVTCLRDDMTITIACQYCRGSGTATLSAVMAKTLDAVAGPPGIPTSEVRRRLRIGSQRGRTALANRLAKLERLGCVRSTGSREKTWTRIR